MSTAPQDRPVCFDCDDIIKSNAEMLFEAPCGHASCSSAVFHPLCLMNWRDRRTEIFERIQRIIAASQEHDPDCSEHPDNKKE